MEENNWKEAIALYHAEKNEKQVELIRFSERLNTENQGFLNETGAQITIDPFNPRFGQADFIVNVTDEDHFIKSLKNPNEPVNFLGEANDGKIDTTGSFPTASGPNPCGWNHGGKVENIVEYRPYELQKGITSACVHIPNGGTSGFAQSYLYFNIGSFAQDTNIHLVFKYLWKYYYQWDFTAGNKFSDDARLHVRINLLQIQNGKVLTTEYGSYIERLEISRNTPNMPISGVRTISPTLKTKAETFHVRAGQGYQYVAEISTYCYTWPVNGSTFIKNDFQLVPYT